MAIEESHDRVNRTIKKSKYGAHAQCTGERSCLGRTPYLRGIRGLVGWLNSACFCTRWCAYLQEDPGHQDVAIPLPNKVLQEEDDMAVKMALAPTPRARHGAARLRENDDD